MEIDKKELLRLKKENEELRQEVKKLKKSTSFQTADFELFENSPSGIIIVGDNYKIEYVNKAFASIIGLSIENLIGLDFRSRISGKYKNQLSERYSKRREGESIPEHYEFNITHPDGRERNLELTSSTIKNADGKYKTIAQIIDVTEKKQASEALIESEEKYRNLVENSPDGVILSDLQGNILTANKKCLEMFGYASISEIQGEGFTIFSMISEEDRNIAWDNADLTQNGHFFGTLYYTLLKKDGTKFPAEIQSVVLNNVQGLPKTFLSIARDLTDRQKAEIALKTSRLFLQNIFDSIQDGICVIDRNMNIVMVNAWMEKMYPDTMPHIGKKCFEVYHQRNSTCDDCASHNTFMTGQASSSRVDYRINGKTKGFIELSAYPVKNDQGEVINVIEYVKDITIQEMATRSAQANSARLSNIMRAANDGMWDWHLASGEVYFDPRYYQMAGYEVDEFPYQLDEYQKRVHPDDLDLVMKKSQAHLEGKTERFIVEFRFKKKNNSWMWILGRGIIVERDDNGIPLRLMGTHTDISELKKAQSDLQKAKNKAEESDRLKSAFLANMSHEIRTPMNGILGFAELLLDDFLSKEEISNYVSIIRSSGARMLNTINDIIDISKIEAGQTELYYSEANINDHITYLYKFFLPETKKKNLYLKSVKSLSEKNAIIKSDHEKLISIFINLIKNAIKFTSTGGIEFGYKLSNSELQFYVKDTGIGISKNRQKAIFDRFVQADLSITKPYEGSGLGLSISKAFVELLGGKIWLESELGQGSKFSFSLPFTSSEDMPNSKSDIENSSLNNFAMKELEVLVVEDDEGTQFFLNEVLKKKCKKIHFASTGSEAVEICKKEKSVGLVLMDIKLPGIDGFEATKQIREFNKEVIIIGQTAYALLGDKKKVIEAGCDDYISKPIDRSHLFKLIDTHLHLRNEKI